MFNSIIQYYVENIINSYEIKSNTSGYNIVQRRKFFLFKACNI